MILTEAQWSPYSVKLFITNLTWGFPKTNWDEPPARKGISDEASQDRKSEMSPNFHKFEVRILKTKLKMELFTEKMWKGVFRIRPSYVILFWHTELRIGSAKNDIPPLEEKLLVARGSLVRQRLRSSNDERNCINEIVDVQSQSLVWIYQLKSRQFQCPTANMLEWFPSGVNDDY